MEFNFDVRSALRSEGVTRWEASDVYRAMRARHGNQLAEIIDAMGMGSAKAQKLGAVITTTSKLLSSSHILYIASNKREVLGILRIGVKKLFIRTETGLMHEISPMCVLDFYVHERCQRQGVGSILFEYMLKDANVRPSALAYDRPSPKLIGFLSKHYDLHEYVPQNNNFVVFNDYFIKDTFACG